MQATPQAVSAERKSLRDDYRTKQEERLATPNLVDCFIAAKVDEGWRISYLASYTRREKNPKSGKWSTVELPPEEWGYINKQLNMRVSYPRLREWAKGRRQVPDEVAALMAKDAMPWILRRSGLTGELREEVYRAIAMRAYPWLAPLGKRQSHLTEQEQWFVAAVLPPEPEKEDPAALQAAIEQAKRAVKRAPRKVKSAKPAKRARPHKAGSRKVAPAVQPAA